MSMAIPVPALKITATDILIRTAVAADGLATAIGCATVARAQLTHGVTIWFDAAHTDPTRRPNRAAVCLLLNCSDLEEDTVPIPAGDVVLTGTDPDTGGPAELTTAQYIALAMALVDSAAA